MAEPNTATNCPRHPHIAKSSSLPPQQCSFWQARTKAFTGQTTESFCKLIFFMSNPQLYYKTISWPIYNRPRTLEKFEAWQDLKRSVESTHLICSICTIYSIYFTYFTHVFDMSISFMYSFSQFPYPTKCSSLSTVEMRELICLRKRRMSVIKIKVADAFTHVLYISSSLSQSCPIRHGIASIVKPRNAI